ICMRTLRTLTGAAIGIYRRANPGFESFEICEFDCGGGGGGGGGDPTEAVLQIEIYQDREGWPRGDPEIVVIATNPTEYFHFNDLNLTNNFLLDIANFLVYDATLTRCVDATSVNDERVLYTLHQRFDFGGANSGTVFPLLMSGCTKTMVNRDVITDQTGVRSAQEMTS
ncbi:MAG: hypothetical protein ACE5JO_10005, partial [Candidatus Binatia bacterium]